MKTLMLIAGGTGGHIFPAFHIAEHASQNNWKVIWVSGFHGLENQIKAPTFLTHERIDMSGFRGKSLIAKTKGLYAVLPAMIRSLMLIKKHQPDVVICMGGYLSLPAGLAAWISRKPLCLHESNTRVGLSNRLLSPFAKHCFLGFDIPGYKKKTLITGNPLSSQLKTKKPLQVTKFDSKRPLKILLIGGSRGAKKINDSLMDALVDADFNEASSLNIWHQTGSTFEISKKTIQIIQKNCFAYQNHAFIDDMPEAYEWADCIICRSGAMTTSEIEKIALPAIFIPYPHAIDNHQYHNASTLADQKRAWIIEEKDLSKTLLQQRLKKILHQPEILKNMHKKSLKANKNTLAQHMIVDICQQLTQKT